MSYFIGLMSSLLFYNVENNQNKENPLSEYVCSNFWLVLYMNSQKQYTRVSKLKILYSLVIFQKCILHISIVVALHTFCIKLYVNFFV